jgi:hypothetical protein
MQTATEQQTKQPTQPSLLASLSALSVEAITSGTATQTPPDHLDGFSQAVAPAPADLEALLEDSAKFRADLLRRYNAPYPDSWRHGGLND